LAQYWERAADDLKNAIPEEYRKRIEQIRRWKPWNDEEEEKEVEEDDISDIQSGDEDYIENSGEIEDLLESLEDELEQLDETVIDSEVGGMTN
jgi:translation initiation factor IF-2